MRKTIIVLFLLLTFLLAACIPKPHGEIVTGKAIPAAPPVAENTTAAPPTEPQPLTPMVNTTCTDNADCLSKLCIDHSCKAVQELYRTDCPNKCHFEYVAISTSDGESYTLKAGQGSYSYAGAIEWKVHSVPDYCPTSSIPILIDILKKNTGRVLSTEVITLQQGQTSTVIRHPTIARIAFTVTLDGIKQVCY